MSYYDEDKVFKSEAIRDTSSHNSDESHSGEFSAKTIIIENGLDQTVTFQLQGARNSTWQNIGSTWNVSASSNNYQTVSDYFPKYRIQASCGTSPTTGALDVWIVKAN